MKGNNKGIIKGNGRALIKLVGASSLSTNLPAFLGASVNRARKGHSHSLMLYEYLLKGVAVERTLKLLLLKK